MVTEKASDQKQIRTASCGAQLRMLPCGVVDSQLFMLMSRRSKELGVPPQLSAFLNLPTQIERIQSQQRRFEAMQTPLYPPAPSALCGR